MVTCVDDRSVDQGRSRNIGDDFNVILVLILYLYTYFSFTMLLNMNGHQILPTISLKLQFCSNVVTPDQRSTKSQPKGNGVWSKRPKSETAQTKTAQIGYQNGPTFLLHNYDR